MIYQLYGSVLRPDVGALVQDDPSTIKARADLAHCYRSAGRTSEAVPVFEEVAAQFGRLLGSVHTATVVARIDLAAAYWTVGRIPAALAVLKGVAADCERLLGADDPQTVTARLDLATAYWSARRTAEAVALERSIMDEAERPHLALVAPAQPEGR